MTLEEKLKDAQTALYDRMEVDRAAYLSLINMSVDLTRADESRRAVIASEFAALELASLDAPAPDDGSGGNSPPPQPPKKP